MHEATVVLIEDKASGTQLIQELSQEGMSNIKKYTPRSDWNKEMRLIAQTGAIENGLVHVPEAAEWLDTYLHEMTTFPASKHDDQVELDLSGPTLDYNSQARNQAYSCITSERWRSYKGVDDASKPQDAEQLRSIKRSGRGHPCHARRE